MERANRRESPRIALGNRERIARESPLKHTRQSLPEWSLERGVGRSDDRRGRPGLSEADVPPCLYYTARPWEKRDAHGHSGPGHMWEHGIEPIYT